MVKVITFFNEKGGTGKTTLTALFASWLAYNQHERVFVIDMDYPMFQLFNMRENDKNIWKQDPDSQFAMECAANSKYTYPVGKAAGRSSFTEDNLRDIASALQKQIDKAANGYFLLDFPGRYLSNDPVHYLSRKGMIDLVVFPIDSDKQSRASALQTYHQMQAVYEDKAGSQNAVFLWNREASKERLGNRDWYAEPNRLFAQLGIPVIEKKVRDILIARRDASTFGYIRNTLCWPQKNINRACGYIEQIFAEIKSRADGTWNETKKIEIYG